MVAKKKTVTKKTTITVEIDAKKLEEWLERFVEDSVDEFHCTDTADELGQYVDSLILELAKPLVERELAKATSKKKIEAMVTEFFLTKLR